MLVMFLIYKIHSIYIYIYTHIQTHNIYRVFKEESALLRENVPQLIYIDITKPIHNPSRTLGRLKTREKFGLPAFPLTAAAGHAVHCSYLFLSR